MLVTLDFAWFIYYVGVPEQALEWSSPPPPPRWFWGLEIKNEAHNIARDALGGGGP